MNGCFEMRFGIILSLLSIVFFFSCVPHKKTLLLKSSDEQAVVALPLKVGDVYYKVQVEDLIDVKVASPDVESMQIFNPGGGGGGESSFYLNSYQVDREGNIQFPLLGDIYVLGLTTTEIKDLISEKLESYFKQMTVAVRLVSFKVTFLGEVNNPSTISLYSEHTNFFEALSKVGGLSQFANSRRVKIVRKDGGEAEVYWVDISTQDFLSSEYFYLQPNDIVYIEPLKAKAVRGNLTLWTFVTGAITLTLLVVRTFR